MWKTKKEVSLVGILSATLLLNAAAACMWPLTTVYMHNQLHQTLALAGVALLGMSLCMIVGNWLGGWLFDNWSPFKSALVGTLCSWQITSLIRTSPESFNGSLLMMYF
nr:hypothetical protein [Levilactobacillus brevis]